MSATSGSPDRVRDPGVATGATPGLLAASEQGRRGEILEAALTVFAEKGYEAGTMRDIAARVGVTEPALYRHFSGKEELFLALLEAVAALLREQAFGALDGIDPGHVRDSIVAVLAERRAAVRLYGEGLRTVVLAAAHNPAILAAYRDAIAEPIRSKLTETVSRVDHHQGIRRPQAEVAARVRALMSVAVGSAVTSMVLADEPDAATADAIAAMMGWN